MEGISIQCRAAVNWTPGSELRVQDILVAPPQSGEVRVKILYSSLCHSDLSFWHDPGQAHRCPFILGHEGSGVVESVGENVEDFKPGDYVITLFQPECKKCRLCKLEKTNLCDTLLGSPMSVMNDQKPRFSTLEGEPIYHFLKCSTFSEYTVLMQHSLAKIETPFPLSKACLLSCGVPTGLGAVWKLGKVEPGSTVAVIGLGTVGLAAVEGSRIAGASRIVAVDIEPSKLEIAKQFGATDFINPSDHEEPLEKVVHGLVEGGVDYSFECVGKARLALSALECCHLYGTSVVIGICKQDDVTEFAPARLVFGRQWKSGFFGGFKGRTETEKLVKMCTDKDIDLDRYITHRLPFSSINQGFELLTKGGVCIKCVFHMDDNVE